MTIIEHVMNSKGSFKYCQIYSLWIFIAAICCICCKYSLQLHDMKMQEKDQ